MVFFGRAPAAPAPPPPGDGTLFACLAAAGLGAALLLVLRRRASASKKSSTAAHAAISVPPLRGWKSSPGISKALVPSRTNVRAGPWPVPLYKYSELFAPAGGLGSDGAPVPGVIVMHGWCFEEPFTKSTAGAVTSLIMTGKTGQLVSWDYTRGLCEALAKEGYAVLMIGLRDDDEEVLLADFPEMDEDKKALLKQSNGGIANCWPAKYYAKALNAAIDHLVYAAQKFHGVLVDEAKMGLVGHSMGGAGVLYAAAVDCVDRIACVASLNPSLGSIESPVDHSAQLVKYFSGAPHSGEHGEGEMPFLKKIKAPTLIYGSQAEYNTELFPKSGMAPMWPVFPCTFEQVGARVKELYVDNLKTASCMEAHCWCCSPQTTGTFAGGLPLKVVLSFLRRHCARTGESPLERPTNALEWKVLSA